MTVRLTLLVLSLPMAACDVASWQPPERAGAAAPATSAPQGSVPRGGAAMRAAISVPPAHVDDALIQRGADRYLVFCAPCHGRQGHGDGPIVQRGFPAPPSLHIERLRRSGPPHVVQVTTDGVGKMYSFADRVPPVDRWAIAYYVQVMQGQHEASRGRTKP